jgi:hypothetical protein
VTHGTQVLKMGGGGGLGLLEGSLAGVLGRGRTRGRQCEHAGREEGREESRHKGTGGLREDVENRQ